MGTAAAMAGFVPAHGNADTGRRRHLAVQTDQRGTPWVFPCLERAYLRHPEGLTMVRRFLANAYAGNLGRGIIGCDSWAWAFLRHVWRGRVPVTVTLQAFDETRLARHFRQAGRCFRRQAAALSSIRQRPRRPAAAGCRRDLR